MPTFRLPGRTRRIAVVLGACAVVAPASYAALVAPALASSKTVTVKLSGMQFSPRSVKISKGSRVKFVWAGGGHNLVGHGVKTNVMSTGSKTLTFHNAGSYTYICQVHSGMSMKVIVH